MLQPLSKIAEVYDLDKMTLHNFEEAQSLKEKSFIIRLDTIHLWINKHNVLEFYIKPDVRKLELKKKHFILIRFLGPYCGEHRTFHPGTMSDEQIRYLTYFLLCRLARFMPIALLKETKFHLTVKMVQDVQFIEMDKVRSNPYDMSRSINSQTMDATTFETQTNQLIEDTELICNQVRQFKDNLYRMIFNEYITKYLDQQLK